MLASAVSPASPDFDVRHLARLARLRLTPEEETAFTRHLTDILAYADGVRRIDTEGVPPMTHVLAPVLPERDDREAASLAQADALANAPDAGAGLFRVPPVLG